MSIEAAELRKLVKIVRQYEVIYGGGISTSDAAVREECDRLVARLESELGSARRGSAGGAASGAKKGAGKAKDARPASTVAASGAAGGRRDGRSRKGETELPSLVEAGRAPRGEKSPRPLGPRASELAGLAAPARESAPQPAKSSPAKGAAPAGKAPVPAKKAPVPAKKPPVPDKAAVSGKSARSASDSELGIRAKRGGSSEPEVRSQHAGAAKAAIERAERRTGSAQAEAAGGREPKKRFAATHLFDAFKQNKLPKYGGYIVCIRFVEEQHYSIVEIIGYENLQDIYPEGDSLIFKSVGCKLYAVVEPSSYLLKSVEPVNRPKEQMIPYRFSELLRITTKRFQNVLIGRKPVFMPTSFSVFKPSGEDLAVLFYDIADVYSNIEDFLIMLMRERMGVPVPDSRKAAEVIARGIREFKLWLDEA